MLDTLRQDLRYASRQLRRSPGFAAVAVLTLAVGVGATTAIFSVVEAVLLRPLAMEHPERTMLVSEVWKGRCCGDVSAGNFVDLKGRARGFDQVAAMSFRSMALDQGRSPERVLAALTTWNLFPALGVPPLLGRAFEASEDAPGHDGVVVLGYRLWKTAFGGDPNILERSVDLDGRPRRVIGVMPASFDPVLAHEQLWVPIAFTAVQRARHDEHTLTVIGVRKREVTVGQARRELSAIGGSLAREFPRDDAGRGLTARPLRDVLLGSLRSRLLISLGAVVCVLLIACGDVTNLLLARAAGRTKELAVRSAMGAGHGRIARQILTETLVLAVAATAVGIALAWIATRVLVASAPPTIPRIGATRIDGPALAVALAIAVASSLVSGLAPALRVSRGDLAGTLREGGRTSASGATDRVRVVLVGTEVAIALTLLVGAALLIRSALYLQATPLGFDPHDVLSARVALPDGGDADPDATRRAFENVAAALTARPGVRTAALASAAPLAGSGVSNGLIPKGRPLGVESEIDARLHIITPDYFGTLRIPVLRGRPFTDRDTRTSRKVMIVSAALAKAAWPGENPIGRRVACCESAPEGPPDWKTVIGVAGDVRGRGPTADVIPEFYLPLPQAPAAAWRWVHRTMTIVARGDEPNPGSLAPIIRQAVQGVDPGTPVFSVATMEGLLARSTSEQQFDTILLLTLGCVGLLLAAVGIYGVVAYLVTTRTHEIGVRMAVGASAADVLRLLAWQGLRPVLGGVAVGALVSVWASRLLRGSLYGVRVGDPVTLVVVSAALIGVSMLAILVPARRAMRVQPTTALDG